MNAAKKAYFKCSTCHTTFELQITCNCLHICNLVMRHVPTHISKQCLLIYYNNGTGLKNHKVSLKNRRISGEYPLYTPPKTGCATKNRVGVVDGESTLKDGMSSAFCKHVNQFRPKQDGRNFEILIVRFQYEMCYSFIHILVETKWKHISFQPIALYR